MTLPRSLCLSAAPLVVARAEASAREARASCFFEEAATTAFVFDFDVFAVVAFFALAFSVAVAAFLLSFCVAAARLGADALRETMRAKREKERGREREKRVFSLQRNNEERKAFRKVSKPRNFRSH